MKFKSLLAALAVFMLNPAPVFSASQPAVEIHATLIIASNEGNDFNLVNDEFRDKLIQLFSYTAYRQIDDVKVTLERGKREKIQLPGGYELLLALQSQEGNRVQVQATIRKGNVQFVDTVVSIESPGVVFLGGPPAEEGTLIIPLQAGF